MTDSTGLVNQLIALRKRRRLTQADMAEHMGVARVTVARFESDTRRGRTPSLFILQRYAAVVGARIVLEINQ